MIHITLPPSKEQNGTEKNNAVYVSPRSLQPARHLKPSRYVERVHLLPGDVYSDCAFATVSKEMRGQWSNAYRKANNK